MQSSTCSGRASLWMGSRHHVHHRSVAGLPFDPRLCTVARALSTSKSASNINRMGMTMSISGLATPASESAWHTTKHTHTVHCRDKSGREGTTARGNRSPAPMPTRRKRHATEQWQSPSCPAAAEAEYYVAGCKHGGWGQPPGCWGSMHQPQARWWLPPANLGKCADNGKRGRILLGLQRWLCACVTDPSVMVTSTLI